MCVTELALLVVSVNSATDDAWVRWKYLRIAIVNIPLHVPFFIACPQFNNVKTSVLETKFLTRPAARLVLDDFQII